MVSLNYPFLAPEGRLPLLIAVLCGIIATWFLGYGSLVIWLMVAFVLQFFRDPKRNITSQSGAIVSPGSGKIVSISESDCSYLNGVRSRKISIFMNVFSVHSNLIPISGTIENCEYHMGKFFNAALDKSSLANERNAISIKTKTGEKIVCVQIAGLIARRILSYVKLQDQVVTGQRYGFIRFGSRVDLYLPIDARVVITLGQRVQSGNDIIGFLPTPKD